MFPLFISVLILIGIYMLVRMILRSAGTVPPFQQQYYQPNFQNQQQTQQSQAYYQPYQPYTQGYAATPSQAEHEAPVRPEQVAQQEQEMVAREYEQPRAEYPQQMPPM